MRFEYFRDSTVALEAFKGDQVDWRTENSAKNWATAYDFPGGAEKRVRAGGVSDPQLRRHAGVRASTSAATSSRIRACAARFNFAFDFEEMNKQIFFGQYKRIASYFEGTELASSGLPQGKELEILEAVREQGAGGGVHDGLYQSGRRQSGSRARQSARGDCVCSRRPAMRCATAS